MTFIIWGLMQGAFLSFEAITNKRKTAFENRYGLRTNPLYILFGILFTFILFTSSLIFSRAESVESALIIFNKIFTNPGPLYIDKTTITYSLIGLAILLFKDIRDEYFPGRILFFNHKSVIVRFASYLFILFSILLIGVLNGGQFIYFQF